MAPERAEDAPWRENGVTGEDVAPFGIMPLFRLNDSDGGFYLDKATGLPRSRGPAERGLPPGLRTRSPGQELNIVYQGAMPAPGTKMTSRGRNRTGPDIAKPTINAEVSDPTLFSKGGFRLYEEKLVPHSI